MPSVQSAAPRSNTRGDSLADILERVLDTGIVIAGDIRVQLADIELLTIQIRLIICSVDKAQQLGMDWWKGASFLTSDPLPVPAAAEPAAPKALAAEQPTSVAAMQQHFEEPAPAWAGPPASSPAWQQAGLPAWQQAPTQQVTPQPTAQPQAPPAPVAPQPPTAAPAQAQPAAPAQAPAPAQPAAPTQPAATTQPAAQAQPSPQASVSDVQAEMLNERLARLEAVLERLLPPEE